MPKNHSLIDRTGHKYGRLTVMSRAENAAKWVTRWNCECECGKSIIIYASHLASGNTQSCGCLQKESLIKVHQGNVKYGDKGKRLYRVWCGVKARTTLSSGEHNATYGGRGIELCEEWAKSYNAFKDWALLNGYKDYLTIDRINNGGNYEPTNCRWATYKEQANNRRSNTPITINGITRNIKEWAELTGINRVTIKNRIKLGWDSNKLLAPVRATKGNI